MDLRILFICCVIISDNTVLSFIRLDWETKHPAFDPNVYENALDSEKCSEQLQHIRRDLLFRIKFLESGLRFPKGLTQFNTVDFGNYDNCLSINENIETSVIEGKYCRIRIPIDSNLTKLAEALKWAEYDESLQTMENLDKFKKIEDMESKLETIVGQRFNELRTIDEVISLMPTLRIALCIPKACTAAEGLRGLLFDLPSETVLGLRFEQEYCRFNDDKPWAPADYVAVVIFSLIGFITILSTGYDIFHTFVKKTDAKSVSSLYKSFSVYTNGKRLTTFNHNPNSLNCVDGIRSISMFWIVAGHTYVLMPHPVNVSYAYLEYLASLKSLWITAAPYTVDTFLFLAGMLLVYTTVGKLSETRFLKSLHLFYLNRILRMFPLLATLVLLQASLLFRISDGPDWSRNASITNTCRTYWWATLLYIQNYVNYHDQCILHSWYLAIDIQCYIVSPLVLYWVLSKKKNRALISLACGVLAALTICSTYTFINKFAGWNNIGAVTRPDGETNYQNYYYYNTLTRAPPFFVGMVFGYIFHEWKGKKANIPYLLNGLLWILSGGTMMTLMYITHLMKDSNWDYWVIDDLNNSFGRSIWVVAVAWIIFACQHGYGGPVNWFLCLDIWKLPSRISYAIYLFHYHMQFVFRGHARQPIFFSDSYAMYNFFSQVLISYGIAFTLTILIDSPCSVLIKSALGGGIKKPSPEKEANS